MTTQTVQKVFVDWTTFANQVDAIIQSLEGQSFDRVVGISRGGLPLGVTLSHKLNLPFTAVGVSSYNDETCEQESLICDTPDVIFEDWKGSILICDDIADSGKTLQFLYEKVAHNSQIERLTTTTLYYKERSVFRPDHYIETTDKWIVFPWEA